MQKRSQGFILTILFGFFGLSFSAGAQEFTLQQALDVSLTNNPMMNANEAKIAAIKQRSKAAWQGLWPDLNIRYAYGKNLGYETIDGYQMSANQSSGSASVTLSMNLYRGGADVEKAKAIEARGRAQLEAYNSTRGQIHNTKGFLAGYVVDIYSRVMMATEKKRFLEQDLGGPLYRLLELTRDMDSRIKISAAITDLRTSLDSLANDWIDYISDFKYIVTVPLPAHLQGFQQVIDSLQIPTGMNEALRVAEQKSHELQQANDELEAAGHDFQAVRKGNRRFRIDANVSYSKNNYSAIPGLGEMQTQGAFVGLTIQKGFGRGHRSLERAAAFERDAANSERDVVLSTLNHDVVRNYRQLQGYLGQQITYESNFNLTKNNIEILLEQLALAEDRGKIDLTLSLIGNLQRQWNDMTRNNQNILMTKFNIQKTIGTLF